MENQLIAKLIEMQYGQIIDAIKSTRERIHQFTISTIVGLPAVVFLVKGILPSDVKYIGNVVILISPILVFSFFLFYLSERAALSRYATYINENIDPIIGSKPVPIFCAGTKMFRGWHDFKEAKYPGNSGIIHASASGQIRDGDDYELKHIGMFLIVMTYQFASIFGSAIVIYDYTRFCRNLTFETEVIVVTIVCFSEISIFAALYIFRKKLQKLRL